jgi:hypothetical protein
MRTHRGISAYLAHYVVAKGQTYEAVIVVTRKPDLDSCYEHLLYYAHQRLPSSDYR